MARPIQGVAAALCALAALAACGRSEPKQAPAASAPAAANVQPELTSGVVQSALDTQLTINVNDTPASFQLSPQTTIMVQHSGTVEDIKPGSFIGTTNVPSADGTGQSVEVHVFPPGVKMGEGDRPMPAAPSAPASRMTNGTVSAAAPASDGSRMTNGSVGAVSNATAGIEMDVAYEGGKRHIVVPAKTPVMVMSSGTAELLKPGTRVLVGSVPGANGVKEATFINIQP
jgi:hypothetical protein